MTKKIARNILKWSVFSVSLTSILFSLLLLYSPAVDAFGGSTANCKGGDPVSCSGYKCTAKDDFGCQCTDASGKVTEKHTCGEKADEGTIRFEESAY